MASASPPPRRPSAPLPSSFDGDPDFFNESGTRKIIRRIREEPLIPLGMGLTIAAFIGAMRAIRQGESVRANMMFRRRIYAQGFTIAAMVGGSYYWKADRLKRKEFEMTVKERQAAERKDKWLRELEARDAEERAFQERMKRVEMGRERREREMMVERSDGDGGEGGEDGPDVAAAAAAAASDEAQNIPIIDAAGSNDTGIKRVVARSRLAGVSGASQRTPDRDVQSINIADAVKQKARDKTKQAKNKLTEVVEDLKGPKE